jgi:hypothetical protein
MGASFRNICVASQPMSYRPPFAGIDRCAIDGNQMPIEQPPSGILIGDPQSLGGQDQGINREFGNQQKADFLGVVVRQVTHGTWPRPRAVRQFCAYWTFIIN